MTAAAQIREEDLPPLAREIAARVGLEPALALIEVFGGTSIRVPLHPQEGNRITQAVGALAAARLSYHFGGETLAMPRAYIAVKNAEREEVLARVRAGELSIQRAAMALGLSSRWVSELVKRSGKR